MLEALLASPDLVEVHSELSCPRQSGGTLSRQEWCKQEIGWLKQHDCYCYEIGVMKGAS